MLKTALPLFVAFSLLLSCPHAQAQGYANLTSPSGSTAFRSTAFGNIGSGGFSRHKFSSASFANFCQHSDLLLTDGMTRQWLGSEATGGSPLGPGSLISDSILGNVRTSAFTVPGFSSLQVTLVQTVQDAQLTQQYTFASSSASPLDLTLARVLDIDLDYATGLDNTLRSSGPAMQTLQGGRQVSAQGAGGAYQGFLAVHGFGVSPNLQTLAYNNFGIAPGDLNTFQELDLFSGNLSGNLDANNDLLSDSAGDTGFIMQYGLTVPANSSASITFQLAMSPSFSTATAAPEPTSLVLLALGGCMGLRRRHKNTG